MYVCCLRGTRTIIAHPHWMISIVHQTVGECVVDEKLGAEFTAIWPWPCVLKLITHRHNIISQRDIHLFPLSTTIANNKFTKFSPRAQYTIKWMEDRVHRRWKNCAFRRKMEEIERIAHWTSFAFVDNGNVISIRELNEKSAVSAAIASLSHTHPYHVKDFWTFPCDLTVAEWEKLCHSKANVD